MANVYIEIKNGWSKSEDFEERCEGWRDLREFVKIETFPIWDSIRKIKITQEEQGKIYNQLIFNIDNIGIVSIYRTHWEQKSNDTLLIYNQEDFKKILTEELRKI